MSCWGIKCDTVWQWNVECVMCILSDHMYMYCMDNSEYGDVAGLVALANKQQWNYDWD